MLKRQSVLAFPQHCLCTSQKTDPFHWLRIRCLFELNQTSLAGLKPISLLTARQLWERNNVSIECPTHIHTTKASNQMDLCSSKHDCVTSRCPLAADLNRASDRLHRGETRHWPLLKRKHRKKTRQTRHAWKTRVYVKPQILTVILLSISATYNH